MAPRPMRWLLALCLALPPLALGAGDVKVDPGASALPSGPVGQSNLQKINPLPAVGGGLETPLNPAAGIDASGTHVAGAVPALPEAAIKPDPAQTAIASPNAGAQTGEWDAQQVLKNGQSASIPEASHQAVEPYFVGALTRLGVPQDLAQRLSNYQTSRHPGDQDKVYHGLGHSQDVPAVVAAIIENQPTGALTDRQSIMLILAAVLHDIDPKRIPETPARVPLTLAYLEQDPASVALLSEFNRRYGITTAMVQSLIKATDFNANPVLQKKIQEEFEASVQTSFPDKDRAWALDWGRKLSFADKSATYLGSVEAADRQVRNLANEIRHGMGAATGKPAANPTDEAMLRGSKNFLKVLKDSPDYAILPAALQSNFEKVYAHFERLADPAVPIPAENAQARGPPQAADAAIRRLSLEGSSSDRDLAALKTAGYAVLAPGALMSAEAEQRVLEIVERDWLRDGEPIFSQLPFNDRTQPLWGPRMVGVREQLDPVVDALTARLNLVLKGEDIEVRDVQLRLATPGKPEKQGMHVDLGGYITATYALRGRGTVLYRKSDAAGREAPTHSWAIITNSEREAATGVLGTVHDTPITDQPRVLLIVRFSRRGQVIPEDELKVVRERGRQRAQGIMNRLAQRGQKPAPAPKPGLIGALKKIFGE